MVRPVPDPASTNAPSGGVLLTGATGFVGMELLHRYLTRTDRPVYAIVRADSAEGATARLRGTVAGLFEDPERFGDRVQARAGDVTRPGLGLEPKVADELAESVSEVVHSAASVSFELGLEESREANVDGTRHMLDFAELCQRRGSLRRFCYVSTAYVAGEHTGRFREDDLEKGQRFRNAYEQTKYEAERLVGARRAQLPVMVVRPSIVVGDRRSGWTASFNVLYWPLRALARGVYPVLPARRSAPVDVVSIDYVADAIFALSSSPDVDGGTYHLTASDEATSIGELLALASEHLGCRAPPVVPPRLYRHAVRPVLARVSPRARRFLDASGAYLPYFAMRVTYDNGRARAALAPAGIVPVPLREYFHRIVDYALTAEWGRRPLSRAAAAARA